MPPKNKAADLKAAKAEDDTEVEVDPANDQDSGDVPFVVDNHDSNEDDFDDFATDELEKSDQPAPKVIQGNTDPRDFEPFVDGVYVEKRDR